MSDATLTETRTNIEPAALDHGDLLAHDAVPASLISMRDIWRTYQMGTEELHALRGVSFDVQRGEYLAIIGPSGSGKSTLMNLIGCLDTPSQGRYWINSKLVSEMDQDELRDHGTLRAAARSGEHDHRRHARARHRRARAPHHPYPRRPD